MVTTCGCSSSQVSGPFGVLTCQRNIKFFLQSIKYIPPTLMAGFVGIYSFFMTSNPVKISFKPFALSESALDEGTNIIKATAKTKGTLESDLIFAHQDGSKIFAGAGLNYLVAGEGEDLFHFSLCSAKVIDNKVSVIKDFNYTQDKISYACTKRSIHKEDINILHEKVAEQEVTYIQVAAGNKEISAIALLGNVALTADDILLNQNWDEI